MTIGFSTPRPTPEEYADRYLRRLEAYMGITGETINLPDAFTVAPPVEPPPPYPDIIPGGPISVIQPNQPTTKKEIKTMELPSNFIMWADGSMRRVSMHVGDPIAEDRVLQAAMPADFESMLAFGAKTWMSVTKTDLRFATDITAHGLRFHTHFRLFNEPGTFLGLVPVFAPAAGSVMMDLVASIPSDFRVFFVTKGTPASGEKWEHFLIARKAGTTAIKTINIPNVFDHGGICMGAEWTYASAGGESPLAYHERATAWYNAAKMNSDLLEHRDRLQAAFRWDPNSVFVPNDAGFAETLRPASSTHFNWLARI